MSLGNILLNHIIILTFQEYTVLGENITESCQGKKKSQLEGIKVHSCIWGEPPPQPGDSAHPFIIRMFERDNGELSFT